MLLCFYWWWPENGLCRNERFLVLSAFCSPRQNNDAECICWKKTKYIIVWTVITGAKCFFINSPFFMEITQWKHIQVWVAQAMCLISMFYAVNGTFLLWFLRDLAGCKSRVIMGKHISVLQGQEGDMDFGVPRKNLCHPTQTESSDWNFLHILELD